MNLYEIEKTLNEFMETGFEKYVDTETGEFDEQGFKDDLGQLELTKDEKIENTGLFIKNLLADIIELKAEEKALAERRKAKENKAEYLKNILSVSLGGNKFETAKIALTFRKSEQVKIVDEEKLPKDFLKEKVTVSADKTAIKKAIKAGQAVVGAELIEMQNLQIK